MWMFLLLFLQFSRQFVSNNIIFIIYNNLNTELLSFSWSTEESCSSGMALLLLDVAWTFIYCPFFLLVTEIACVKVAPNVHKELWRALSVVAGSLSIWFSIPRVARGRPQAEEEHMIWNILVSERTTFDVASIINDSPDCGLVVYVRLSLSSWNIMFISWRMM